MTMREKIRTFIHGICFLALWWWLYSGKSKGLAILYLWTSGWALPRFLSGFHVSSAVEYPFHQIRKVQCPGFPRCPRTTSTLYSSSLSIRSGGGQRKLGPCSVVSLYVMRREAWKSGCIFQWEGMRSL